MTGSYGGDTISGLGGNDTLYGGRGGDDTLAGGDGFDRLYGEDGSDRFDYDAISESKPGSGNRDVIYDFSGVGTTGADQIDLSSIDAIAGGSDDPFAFIGTAAFTAPGQLRVRDVSATNTNTLIQANTTGTSGPELEIVVVDGDTVASGQWTGGDFIL